MLLHAVIYTNRFIPKRFAGYTIGPIILIRPKYRDDKGLLAHEKTHVRQFWRNPFKRALVHISKKIRLEQEVEAYRAQLAYAPHCLDLFATYLATDYGLGITTKDAAKLLKA